MTSFCKIIKQTMRQLSRRDLNGAMPYLMLTSKSESVIRDLLAFRLRKVFKKSKIWQRYEVAREFTVNGAKGKKRVDLAVLESDTQKKFSRPVAIIELKYVANPLSANNHLKCLIEDLRKAKKRVLIPQNRNIFGVLLIREAAETRRGSSQAHSKILEKYPLLKYPLLDAAQEKKLGVIYKELIEEVGQDMALEKKDSYGFLCGADMGCRVRMKWFLIGSHFP